jgi:hypothetical protein
MREYGQGRSTGLEQTVLSRIETGFKREDLTMAPSDRDVLRELAGEVAQIASSDRMKGKRDLWTRHNKLERTRPVVLCDPENGWNEIITEEQMRCTGKIARRWEMDLRKEIFWGREMGDDKPVDRYFDVNYTVSPDDWGLRAVYHREAPLGSYNWENPLKDYDRDLPSLHAPAFTIDWETTNWCFDVAKDLFNGILSVRLKGIWWWSLGLTLPAAAIRGLNNLFLDFVDEPQRLAEFLRVISRGLQAKLDYLEQNGLLSPNNDGTYVGSGGYGYTDELPGAGFGGKVRCCDMWGFAESQETVSVSPEMYERFLFPLEKPILDRFGLNCYGCCEPLHSRWHIVKRHHNLRRVSCSPWVDVARMAQYLEDKYIFSMKQKPTILATPVLDFDGVQKEIRSLLESTRGCCVEIIMKDNHTIGNRPENVVDWARVAVEEAERVAKA